MHGAKWLRVTFLLATGTQVATIFFDHRLVPFSGTVAMVALFGVALTSPKPIAADPWTRHAALAGLALFAAAALLADCRTDGFGWSTAVAGGGGSPTRFGEEGGGYLAAEAVLLAVGAGALAAAVLGRVERVLRWGNLPGALLGMAVLAGAFYVAMHPGMLHVGTVPADPGVRLFVLLSVALVVAVLCLAANAALTSGGLLRQAGAGLLAVGALAWTGFHTLSEMEVFQPQGSVVASVQPGMPPIPRLSSSGEPGRHGYEALAIPLAYAPQYRDHSPLAAGGVLEVPATIDWDQEPAIREALVRPSSWDGGTDLAGPWPAIKATLVAAGLVALAMSLFPPAPRPGARAADY